MKNLFLIIMLFSTQFTFAQSDLPKGFGDYRTIPNAYPESIYTEAYIPPTFKKNVWRDSILLLENNRHLIKNLEEGKDYEIKTEIVEIHSAYTIWEFETPTIDTIVETKTVIVERICEEIEPMPKYENQRIIERQKIFDWSFHFIPRPLTKDLRSRCISYELANNKDACILNYAMIEIPARYVSIEKQVFQQNEKWWTETIADTFYAKRQRFFTTNVNRKIKDYPAVIDTFSRIILFDDILDKVEQYSFSKIYKQVIEKEGYFIEWKEMNCATSCGVSRILEIQKALIKKGYEVPLDNFFGKETKAALIQFQKDNDLIIGSLDRETLELLGVDF